MILRIASRNVLRQRRRTILTVLTMVGGYALSSVSVGWSDGTYSYIIDMFTRNRLGHIQIHADGYMDRPSIHKYISRFEEIGARVASIEGVEAWAPRLKASGLVSFADKSATVGIIGIDPVREESTTGFARKVLRGRTFRAGSSRETIVGKILAENLGVDVGKELVVLSLAADGSMANDLFQVVGIYESGDDAMDRSAIYIPLDEAQPFFALEGRVHEMVVTVEDLAVVKTVTERARRALAGEGLDVSPWQEFARSFYKAMKADKAGMWISLLVIIIIVAVGVLNTVLMSVLERTREYGVLRAMGTRPWQIFRLVLYEVDIMAAASILIGALLGLLGNYVLSRYGISLPETLTYGGMEFRTMYAEVNVRSLVIPALTVWLSALLVSVPPAIRAARTEPARSMRMH